MSSATLELAQQLIRRRSVTPDDAGWQNHIARRLELPGDVLEYLRCGEVSNRRASRQARVLFRRPYRRPGGMRRRPRPEGERAGAVCAMTGMETKWSTAGGTCDGRFIVDICPQVPQCLLRPA